MAAVRLGKRRERFLERKSFGERKDSLGAGDEFQSGPAEIIHPI